MRHLIILVSLCIFVQACMRTVHRREEPFEPKQNFSLHLVKKVISGDRIQLADGKIIKYIGIQAPRPGEKCFIESREANQKLIRTGKVYLKFTDYGTNRDGSYPAYAFVPSRGLFGFINMELISRGFAVTIKNDPQNKAYEKHFFAAEEQARKQRKGLWK